MASQSTSSVYRASSSSTSFGPPRVPDTPSRSINTMLRNRCNKTFDSKPKFMLAQIVCGLFKLITMVYEQIHKDKSVPSQKMWMASCGAVGAGICLIAFIAYSTVIGSAFLLHALLYYGCVGLAVAGVGLCVSGVVYFDKDPAFQQGFEPKAE